MPSILRVKAKWTGFSGAPGYSVFHLRDFGTGGPTETEPSATEAAAAATRVRAFFTAIGGLLPPVALVNLEPEVDLIDVATGNLIDSMPTGSGAGTSGSGTASYVASAGAVVNWRTGAVRNGRRLRGRTFLVPLSTAAFSTGGGLTGTAASTLRTAANNLASNTGSPDLCVYGRPSGPGAADGVIAMVTSANVPDFAAVLRSRRD